MNVKIIPGKLTGEISAMPSKSHAHRILIAQRLAKLQGQDKDDALEIPDFSDDITATKNCLAQLDKDRPFLDCKESGSTLRFMLPVAMALKDESVFLGTGKLPYRPVSPLKEEMENHGCSFDMADVHKNISDKYKEICTVTGRLEPGEYQLPGNVSSQFITGLLFALPLLEGDSSLTITTELESAGYVELTLDVLRDFGITVDVEDNVYTIPGNQTYVEPDGLAVEGDWSNSAFWLVAGALGGDVRVTGLKMNSSQRDREIVGVLQEMGADLVIEPDGENGLASIRCAGKLLHSVQVDVGQIPDLVPVMSVAMALSAGSSLITNAERLMIKESNRIFSTHNIISILGGDITDGGASLSISGVASLQGGEVDSFNDHRIAMAAAIASVRCLEPVIIRGAQAVNKSYPRFFNDFAVLGGEVYEV